MALMHSKGMPVGTSAPPFSLPGVDGKTWSLDSFADAELLVVVFTCNHCPYAIASEDRLLEIQADYADKGVRLVAVNPNDAVNYPADSFDKMVERAAVKAFTFPYLHDESQGVARAYDAACTPDIFVFDRDRKLVYNGRIDDNWQQPAEVTRRDLRAVLDAALEGRPVDFEHVPSMGCSIKWK
jgi:peroxiredoxin